MVGLFDGADEGNDDNVFDGDNEGDCDPLGETEDPTVGFALGAAKGDIDGVDEGIIVGTLVGAMLGEPDDVTVGEPLGLEDGTPEKEGPEEGELGDLLGNCDTDGLLLGSRDGTPEADGPEDGNVDGTSEGE
mmetsp:Transcript_102375/g.153428  ORF Transcript_102375/g.153428 Transcript_102375/m.153428 type:complete len:132 (+) Transcript_102375:859-1254(+)